MMLMHFLRGLSELGFYYALAGTVAAVFGGSLALWALLVQSGCFALSAALQKRGWVRWLAVLPAAVPFFLPGAVRADWIAALPGLGYLVWMVRREDYGLSWSRGADVFSMLWKVCIPFALLFSVYGGVKSLAGQGLPAFLLAAVSSVLLLRSIRHGPDVYCQCSYQLLNGVSAALLLALAWLASTDWFLNGLWAVYARVVLPVLQTVLMAVSLAGAVLFLLVFGLVMWLISLVSEAAWVETEAAAAQGELTKQVREVAGSGAEWLERVVLLLLVAAGAAALFYFFRWMTRRWAERAYVHGAGDCLSPAEAARRREPRRLPRTYAGRIRGQYRRFLRHCRKRGIEIEASDTSEEVEAKACRRLVDRGAELADLRLLYRKARYQGTATREEYARVKKLCGELQKEL